jgi:hypothetical protein
MNDDDALAAAWKNLFDSNTPPSPVPGTQLPGVWEIERVGGESVELVFSELEFAKVTRRNGEPIEGEWGTWKFGKMHRNSLQISLHRNAVFPGKLHSAQSSVDRLFTPEVEMLFFGDALGICCGNERMRRVAPSSPMHVADRLSELKNLMKAFDSLLLTRAQGSKQFALDGARLAHQQAEDMQKYIASGIGRPKIF